MTDDIKDAERRGYSRGYNAGRRKRRADLQYDRLLKEKQAFLDKAFIALLPVAMQVQGWTMGGKQVSDSEQRVELAIAWARRALFRRPLV